MARLAECDKVFVVIIPRQAFPVAHSAEMVLFVVDLQVFGSATYPAPVAVPVQDSLALFPPFLSEKQGAVSIFAFNHICNLFSVSLS